jgi:hypothetical protein
MIMLTIADFYCFVLYFLVCASSIFSGLGILSLLKLNTDTKKILFLSPFIAQIPIVLLLNISVELGIPVGSSYPFIWAVFIAFGVYGYIQNGKQGIFKNKWLIAGWMILPLLILAGPYWFGSATKFGDILPDGWNYISFGQYLWKYPIGTEGGLSPLYQYASTLSQLRFTSSAFLALFSAFFQHHDASADSGVYLGWLVFLIAGSCGFFIAEKQLSDRKKILYVPMVIFSGWIWNVLWATNYDNLLALAYVPVLFGIFINNKFMTKPWAILLGLTLAAFTLVYLELAWLIFGILFVILLIQIVREDTVSRKGTIQYFLVICIIGLSILLPFSKWILTFLSIQLNALSAHAVKPGQGLFLGLLQLKCMPSGLWAMGCEQSLQDPWLYVGGAIITKDWLLAKNILAWILSFIAVTGLVWLVQMKKWGEIIPLFIIVLAVGYTAFVQHYSYGAYKFILLLWWMIPYLLLLGIQYIEEFKPFRSRFVSALLYIPLLPVLLFTSFRVSYTAATKPAMLSSDYAQVRSIFKSAPGNAILVNVDDWLGSEWANYYLRDQDTYLNLKRMYMANASDTINSPGMINLGSLQYVLIDEAPENFPLQGKVWAGKPYSLWKLQSDWILPGDIQNNNGVENLAGKTSVWIGKKKAAFSFLSSFNGSAVLNGEIGPGPSLPPGQPATLGVSNDLGFLKRIKVATIEYVQIEIPVQEGPNQVFVQSFDIPSAIPLPKGDQRVLLASVSWNRYSKAPANLAAP